MTAIKSISKRLRRIDPNELIALSIEKNSKAISDLNRAQLTFGLQSNNEIIFNNKTGRHTYANTPENRAKGRVGQQYILFDKGRWQDSIDVKLGDDEFDMIATDLKDVTLVDDYGPKIKGISENDTKIVRTLVLNDLRVLFRKRLANGS